MNKQELCQKYDALIQATLTNIYSLTKDSSAITITEFKPKNWDHLFFINVADMAQNILGKPLEILCCDWFEWIKLKFIFRNSNIHFTRAKDYNALILPQTVMSYMLPLARELGLPEDFKWADIYKEYYYHPVKFKLKEGEN